MNIALCSGTPLVPSTRNGDPGTDRRIQPCVSGEVGRLRGKIELPPRGKRYHQPNQKTCCFFFSVCGAATFDLVQSLLALATPKTKTFSQPSEIVRQNAFTGGIRVPRSLWPYSLWNYGGCHKTATFQISRKHCEIYSCVT